MPRHNLKARHKIVIAAGAGILLAFFAGPLLRSLADTASSKDFIIQDGFVGIFGGNTSSTDFQVINGGAPIMNSDALSADFHSDTGPVNYSDFSPVSETWRWYSDANDETPTSSLAAENVAPSSIANGQAIKLRLDIAELSGIMGSGNVNSACSSRSRPTLRRRPVLLRRREAARRVLHGAMRRALAATTTRSYRLRCFRRATPAAGESATAAVRITHRV